MPQKKILLIEDNELQGLRLKEMLHSLDFDVIGPADSGEHGIKLFRAHQPDLVLMDISLSGRLDGIQTAEKMLTQFNTPVVYMSGFDNKKIINRAKTTRPLGYLIKPFNREQLYATIIIALDKLEMDIELEKYRLHLESLVHDRTKDLLHSKEKAEESDKLKTAFLENLSHEIRTPMNSMIGFANLIAEEELEKDQKQLYAESILRSGNLLLGIIDDIIEVAKLQSNQIQISHYEVNLKHLLNELEIKYKTTIENSANPDLYLKKIEPPENTPIIKSDPYRLKQILGILIDNAIKFTDIGGVEFGYYPENSKLHFFVKDTGIGIPEHMQDEIFDRFTKIENDRNKLFSGTGLGLHLAKKLASLLGGQIRLKSVVGQGSTFYFDIPLHESKKKQNPQLPRKEWQEKTILIAEDEELNFMFIKETLSTTKARLLWARNGSEAIKYFLTEKIDLILMDIKMPEINGFQAVENIRKKDNQIPIIAQTAFFGTNERQMSMQLGCSDFLTKPINPELLLQTVNRYLTDNDTK